MTFTTNTLKETIDRIDEEVTRRGLTTGSFYNVAANFWMIGLTRNRKNVGFVNIYRDVDGSYIYEFEEIGIDF